ncbi:hypothetical protein BAE44_0023844, partial [Dichanthelium oligosanthes]
LLLARVDHNERAPQPPFRHLPRLHRPRPPLRPLLHHGVAVPGRSDPAPHGRSGGCQRQHRGSATIAMIYIRARGLSCFIGLALLLRATRS